MRITSSGEIEECGVITPANITTMQPMNPKTPREQSSATRGVFVSHVAKALREKRWHDLAMWSVLTFVSIAAFAAVGFAALDQSGEIRESRAGHLLQRVSDQSVVASKTVRRPLDGLMVPADAPAAKYVAVMIDNIAEALPQSGVSKAPLVIEAPVEGGLTRLMAVFPSDADVAKIGPVRSARPYYVDWASEFDALYAHSGGSPEALTRLRTGGEVNDFNEFYNGEAFWRDAVRSAPHNLYTSTALLKKAFGAMEETRALSAWKFKDDTSPEDRPNEIVKLDLGEAGKWNVRWVYDKEKNVWIRVIGKTVQADADGSTVLAKNVVVQLTTVVVLDEIGRRRVDTTSGGDAFFAADGRVIGASWKKQDGRTRFYDAAGNELVFNAGTTWVEVVPTGTPINY